MLGYEGTTTIYEESSEEKEGSGGSLGSAGSSSGGFGEEVTVYAGSSGSSGGGSSSSSSGVEITASPADAAEEALERRLAEGNGTPDEALAFFQRYGHPELSTLPTWDSSIRKWVFPQATARGSSGSIGFATTGSSGSRSGSSSGPGGNTGGGESTASGNGGGAEVNPHGSWGPIAGPDVGIKGPGSDGSGATGSSKGTDGPPHDNFKTGTGLGTSIGSTDGYEGGPAIVDPDNGGDAKGGDKRGDDGGDKGSGADGYGVVDAEGFEGLKAPDGSPLVPYQVHFADRQMDGLFRDILDENNPMLARLALGYLIAPASMGVLVERYFVNAMLAAPAHLYGALALEKAAADALARGDVVGGMADHDAATKHFREAALAIASVLPFGSEAKAAEKGVVYAGERLIDMTMPEWAKAQSWVTKSMFEHVFIVDGQKIMVDGIMSRTGETFVQNAGAIILVEVKTNGAIAWALRDSAKMADLLWQLDMYVGLAQRLEVGGVRYVIVEATEGAPMMQAMRDIIAQRYGALLESGFIEVIFERPPPPNWRGPKWVPKKFLK
ncbi:hypothetical protein [Terripilifer ovatus]|uniref:hypothetical protein n=1 Tax=Terripilifer ovatus TaxID=3032367 RepID=UPI003AB9802D